MRYYIWFKDTETHYESVPFDAASMEAAIREFLNEYCDKDMIEVTVAVLSQNLTLRIVTCTMGWNFTYID